METQSLIQNYIPQNIEKALTFIKSAYDFLSFENSKIQEKEDETFKTKEQLVNYQETINSLEQKLNQIKSENEQLHLKIKNLELTLTLNSPLKEQMTERKIDILIDPNKNSLFKTRNNSDCKDLGINQTTEINHSNIEKFLTKEENQHNKKEQIIQKLDYLINIAGIHSSWIYSPIQLKDKRIATCSWDKSICVLSINIKNKSFQVDIKKKKHIIVIFTEFVN
jgi:predicted RNase H-like nuclease (RuvC/YqgF family)